MVIYFKDMLTRILNLKIILILLIIGLFYIITISISFAAVPPGSECDPADPAKRDCDKDPQGFSYSCLPAKSPPPPYLCQRDVFGKITPPTPLQGFITNNTTGGAGAISQFLSNLIILIYSLAGIVLIFMLIWGAFQWLTSGGDKEAVAAAQKRILNAIIGIALFAVAFAIIRVVGVFTGFTFFK